MSTIARIIPGTDANSNLPTRSQSSASQQDAVNSVSSRALVPVSRPEPVTHQTRRPAAVFLAHLIAVQQKLPQTREKRRADPGAGAAVYAQTAASDQRRAPAVLGSIRV